ncbi:VanZ family protein [Wukongibacter baidiensis]|uniref:VanZ family protein n=1 Tax=Wukongibacter baidiensis TaxID=1723361 RepID=UPI003D7F61AC
MFRRVVPILLVIVWLFVIFNFSSQQGNVSQSKSQQITDHISENYDEIVTGIDNDKLHYLVRKSAHVSLYFVLGILVMNALFHGGFRGKGLFVRAFIICLFYASMDEIHQKFISDRSGKLTDVFIDGIGIVLAMALALILERAYNVIRKC